MACGHFIELSVRNIDAAKELYTRAFNWHLTAFCPTYACTMAGDVHIGRPGDSTEAAGTRMPVIAEDLEAVTATGSKPVRPIVALPGERRFPLDDPYGEELAVMQAN